MSSIIPAEKSKFPNFPPILAKETETFIQDHFECPISMEVEKPYVLLPCLHRFGKDYAKMLKGECSLCRAKYTEIKPDFHLESVYTKCISIFDKLDSYMKMCHKDTKSLLNNNKKLSDQVKALEDEKTTLLDANETLAKQLQLYKKENAKLHKVNKSLSKKLEILETTGSHESYTKKILELEEKITLLSKKDEDKIHTEEKADKNKNSEEKQREFIIPLVEKNVNKFTRNILSFKI